MAVPEIVFGAATLSVLYNSGHWLASDIPYRTLRLALRCALLLHNSRSDILAFQIRN